MFNLNINWLKIVKENLPSFLQKNRRIDFLKVLICPFVKIYTELLQAFDLFVLKIRYNGQVMYLEKILNKKFSPITGGIYIEDGFLVPNYYVYNRIELKDPIYIYNRWTSSLSFSPDEFCIYQNKVWKSLTSNSNSVPSLSNTDWSFVREVIYMRQREDFSLSYNFIVKVPASLVFNIIHMRAILDYYKLAGTQYKIITY